MSEPTPQAGAFRPDWPARAGQTIAWRGRAWPLALMAGALFACNLALQFPGLMTNDSVNQYAEAVSGRYTDWHPPVMAWLFSVLLRIHEGPAPLFVLHMVGYWTGWWLLADATRRGGRANMAFLIPLAGLFPTFVFLNASLNKDVGMAAAWLPAAGLLYWYRTQDRRVPLMAGMIIAALLAYGTLVRTNAVFGLGPLLLFALAPAAWLRNIRLMIAAVAVAVIAIPLTQQANRILFHPVERQAVHSLFLFDLAGIAAHEGDPSLVAPRASLNAEELRKCYTPYWWDSFSPWGSCAGKVMRPDDDHATNGDGLPMQWVRTIAAHPMAYAIHRLKHFNSELMFAVPLKHIRLTPEYRTDNPAFKPLETITPRDVRFDLVRKNPTVWPVTWVAWAIVLLAFLARAESSPAVLLARTLAVSALGYAGAYLVIGVATDVRYHYWTVLATVVATLVVLPSLAAGYRRRSRVLLGGTAAVGFVIALGLAARLLDFQAWSA
ncbi:MAG: hypothetical protein K0Q43_2940 [Ramlibacter sp.]|jgi:hypothetical protein|nr:hypothetical protein [Ramlibacter sp.]